MSGARRHLVAFQRHRAAVDDLRRGSRAGPGGPCAGVVRASTYAEELEALSRAGAGSLACSSPPSCLPRASFPRSFFSRTITAPLRDLAQVVGRFAAGDFGARLHLRRQRRDEGAGRQLQRHGRARAVPVPGAGAADPGAGRHLLLRAAGDPRAGQRRADRAEQQGIREARRFPARGGQDALGGRARPAAHRARPAGARQRAAPVRGGGDRRAGRSCAPWSGWESGRSSSWS